MATTRKYEVGPFTLLATGYGSLTHEAFVSLQPEDFNAVGHLQFASMTGDGQLDATIAFAALSGASDLWTNTLTFATLSAASGAAHAMYSTADDQIKPLLPNCRVRVTAKAKSASVVFSDVIARLFVET